MDDKEMLELAAKAMQAMRDPNFANFDYASEESGIRLELGCRRGAITSYWNPLTDDGDALRLAVKLGMVVDVGHGVIAAIPPNPVVATQYEHYAVGEECPYAATRRAIVRAAAEIGKGMK